MDSEELQGKLATQTVQEVSEQEQESCWRPCWWAFDLQSAASSLLCASLLLGLCTCIAAD